MKTITINAMLTEEDNEDGYERGADIIVPEDTNACRILEVLFDDFEDRLKKAGIDATIDCNFT